MALDDDLLAELLTKPVGPTMPKRTAKPEDMTKEVTVSGSTATIEAVVDNEDAHEGAGLGFLKDEGLNPSEWEVTGFRKSEWESGDSLRQSVRFTYRRLPVRIDSSQAVADALAALSDYEPVLVRPEGSHGFLVLIGDMQFGKIDGDGPAGTLARTIRCIDRAADTLLMYRQWFDIGHIHIAWLGDHIEGFVSQGGANVFRTVLTLNEQIRLTQAVMLHALKTFSPLAARVTMVAVPGNHGEPVRFEGKGTTRYDDSHDTETLIGIHNTIKALDVPGFEHVSFYVPDTDELTVQTEVAGTRILHAHGHKFGTKKDAYLEWWKGQEFGREGLPAHLLVAGHNHTTLMTDDFIQVPALESESTWYRHIHGAQGNPGLITAITKGGRTPIKHTIN
jgi:hypothetical protein